METSKDDFIKRFDSPFDAYQDMDEKEKAHIESMVRKVSGRSGVAESAKIAEIVIFLMKHHKHGEANPAADFVAEKYIEAGISSHHHLQANS